MIILVGCSFSSVCLDMHTLYHSNKPHICGYYHTIEKIVSINANKIEMLINFFLLSSLNAGDVCGINEQSESLPDLDPC